ncbi:MAG TPA: hypothetical protein VN625_02590, partial [Desulfuromonadaceae bacterium]|nr:hypothetical protein [Desulfuromonadaceae bacterium]
LFIVLSSGAMITFFLMLNSSTALRYNANDISRAMEAGERWRADVRGATGWIQSGVSTNGVTFSIPHRKAVVAYRLSEDTLWRQNTSTSPWVPVLNRVKNSQMETAMRGTARTCVWELELIPRKTVAKVPLAFSFEAVAPDKP